MQKGNPSLMESNLTCASMILNWAVCSMTLLDKIILHS